MEERLYKKYKEEIAPKLMEDLGLTNVFELPRLEKIVVNAGIGSFKDNKEAVDMFLEEFTNITGQKPSVRKARLSVAGFKIRQGDVIGVAVTLRGDKMWAFLDKLVNIVLPRFRDFKGVSIKSFDKNGNYSLGITEHTIFPEVNANTTKGIRSLQATLVTSVNDVKKSKALLEALGMPFRKDNS